MNIFSTGWIRGGGIRGGRESAETDSELAQVVHTCFKGYPFRFRFRACTELAKLKSKVIHCTRWQSYLLQGSSIHLSIYPSIQRQIFKCVNGLPTNVLWVKIFCIWTGITRNRWHGESEKAASGPSIIVNGGLAIDQIIKGKFWLLDTRFRNKTQGCLSGLLRPRWRWKEEKAAGKGGAEETAGGTSQTELARRQSPLKKNISGRQCFWNYCCVVIVEAQNQMWMKMRLRAPEEQRVYPNINPAKDFATSK